MVQLSTSVCFLGGLLGLFLLGPVLMAQTPASMCTPLRTLNESLSHRRRYMKHFFPINYTIRVHQKQLFRLKTISRLRVQIKDLDDVTLQRLWFGVNGGILKKIKEVIPKRHPSYPYTTILEELFEHLEGVFTEAHPDGVPEKEYPEAVQVIWDVLGELPHRGPETDWRFASPKSLLDNFYRTMRCLFSDCFASQDTQKDYCSSSWKEGKKKGVEPES